MEFTQQTQKTQGPAPLNFFRIPSPMHSSSQQTVSVSASPQGLQLPVQGFNLQAEADAVVQTSTPLAIQTPSNVATTHWRTMVCPGAPMHPRQAQPSELQRHGSLSISTPVSSVSPASQWSIPTPHRSLSFEGCGGLSMPPTPTGQATPTGIGLNTAFIASTPVHEGRITLFDDDRRRSSLFDGDLNMFAMRARSLSGMSVGSDTTPSMMVRPQ